MPTKIVPLAGKPAVDPTVKVAVPEPTFGEEAVTAAETLVFLSLSLKLLKTPSVKVTRETVVSSTIALEPLKSVLVIVRLFPLIAEYATSVVPIFIVPDGGKPAVESTVIWVVVLLESPPFNNVLGCFKSLFK